MASNFPDALYLEVSGAANSGNFPNSSESEAAMTTAGKTVVLASSGTRFGDYGKQKKLVIAQAGNAYGNFVHRAAYRISTDTLVEITMSAFGTSNFPNSAEAESSMPTASKTVVLASSGNRFGNYANIYKLVVALAGNPLIPDNAFALGFALGLSFTPAVSYAGAFNVGKVFSLIATGELDGAQVGAFQASFVHALSVVGTEYAVQGFAIGLAFALSFAPTLDGVPQTCLEGTDSAASPQTPNWVH